ncbi:MAG: DUF4332 domain-containing protein [Desulfobacteraceae bacterium]|nr:DUF4332 domain-containing protein [Desulfobacteraceae bacterium]
MGQLNEDMTRLREEIDALRNQRKTFIDDLRRGTGGLKQDVYEMQARFRKERAEEAGKTKNDLQAFVSEIKDFISELRDGVEEMREKLGNDHSAMAEKLKGDLGNFMGNMKSEVSGMLSDFQSQRTDSREKTKQEIADFVSGLRQSVAEIQNSVTSLREQYAEDIVEARRAWTGVQTVKPKPTGETGKKVRQAAPGGGEDAQAEQSTAAEDLPDDLSIIQGIGSGMQSLLNDAGIYTYAQLAASNPEELRAKLGKAGRMASVDDWIEQARKIAGKE